MVASEAVPFAKTGGLADVLGALPAALARLGWAVTMVLPRYRGVAAGRLAERLTVTMGGRAIEVAYWTAPAAGGEALLVDAPELFDREGLYGIGNDDYPDNALRFGLLARAALEFARRMRPGPTVVHAHDWQAGLVPVYLRTRYADDVAVGGAPIVFTIHNLAYQGLFSADWMPRLDLGWDLFTIEGLEFWGRMSFLKGGINAADVITTVSPQYAREIQTPDYGCGFDGILRRRSKDLVGILNGIDTEVWDPSGDPYLPAPYDASDLSGKREAKRVLLLRYGLAADARALDRPLVGMISRMVDQKGLDLIAALGDRLAAFDASWVVLGTGEARYQDFWTDLARRYPDRVGVRIGFDEGLAHLIEAGADLFLMPSRFEPCGLNQMYSLRYGTVPVVHGVGGLLDTVRDYSPRDSTSTGFVFRLYTPAALAGALERAFDVFKQRERWRALQAAGMRQDHSWDRSAREYVKIYEKACGARGRPCAGGPATPGRDRRSIDAD